MRRRIHGEEAKWHSRKRVEVVAKWYSENPEYYEAAKSESKKRQSSLTIKINSFDKLSILISTPKPEELIGKQYRILGQIKVITSIEEAKCIINANIHTF